MPDGLFQLFFIILIVAASVMDAVARNRKKKERMEEMERAEAEEGVPELEEDSGDILTRDSGDRDWSGTSSRGKQGRTSDDLQPYSFDGEMKEPKESEEAEPAPRETADAMVPDDLWAILTGESRAPRETETPPEPEEVKVKPPEPVRAEQDYRTAPGTARSPTPTSRRSEGRSGGRSDSVRRTPPPPVNVPGESEVYQAIEEPWGDIPDISIGEIRDDGTGADLGDSEGRALKWGVRQGRDTSPYVELLKTGRSSDLRQAIVLSEVLGPPVGMGKKGRPYGLS
jgi:hypothetical protein